MGLDEGYLSRIIKSLAAHGLIKRVRSKDDARVHILRLTEHGERSHKDLVGKAKDVAAKNNGVTGSVPKLGRV